MARQGAGISEQHTASFRRWEDAQVLLVGSRWWGAMYMAGYAIECTLKATLMREWHVVTLAELQNVLNEKHGFDQSLYTHDIELLFGLTRIGRSALQSPKPSASQRQLVRWFKACNAWSVSWRYKGATGDQATCAAMLSAAEPLINHIRSST